MPPGAAGRPENQPVSETGADDPYSGPQYDPEVDKRYWLACLSDAERAEEKWRQRGRDIISIYRNESKNVKTGKPGAGNVTFNILYANTEVMLSAIYQKPPQPVVRSRFTSVPTPLIPPPPAMMGAPGMLPPGAPAAPMAAMVPPPPMAGPPPNVPAMPPVPPALSTPEPPSQPVPGQLAPPSTQPLPEMAGPLPAPPMPGMIPPMGMPPPAMSGPPQKDVETAASVMEKALEIVVDDENSHEAVKLALKDVLLPGRGLCRVRWKPEMKAEPLPGGPLPDGTAPTEMRKVWEETGDEYVYWEDFLCDPVRSAADMNWIAFRHLFTKQQMDAEFDGSPEYEKLKAEGKVDSLLRWTDEAAAKSPVGGGGALKSAGDKGDHVRKCMIWEIWDRIQRRVIWFIRETHGLLLRVDPDTLQLAGFYPIPVPLLAVWTSDSRIPRPYYDLYSNLAGDLDDTSKQISKLTNRIKVKGLYNSTSREIADLLTADDGKMIGVAGVDMINGGLANHIWIYPINDDVKALQELYLARDQVKQAIYEVMGISDIMRGATKASETATAQRIKGTMGVTRLEDQKQAAGNFVRDLLRLKAEIIAQNFDAETLSAMTGEEVTPGVMDILRDDFQRTCKIDIETDSTVTPDMQAEQEGMAMTLQAANGIGQMIVGLIGTQVIPPPLALQLGLEMLKMAVHPIPNSRGVTELVQAFQDTIEMQVATQPMMIAPQVPQSPPPQPPGPTTNTSGDSLTLNIKGGGQAAAPNLPPGGPINGAGPPSMPPPM